MKQHLGAAELKELNFEDRITLISIATGFNKQYLKEEYNKGLKNEDAMLLQYGFNVKMGELIELILVYTGKFPTPTISNSNYSIDLTWDDGKEKFLSGEHTEYVNALFEVIKYLFEKEYIYIQ